MMSDTSAFINVSLYKSYKHAKRHVEMFNVTKIHISSSSFNIDAYFDRMFLHEFRFRMTDIPRITAVINLPNGKTGRKGYVYDEITNCIISPKRISSP